MKFRDIILPKVYGSNAPNTKLRAIEGISLKSAVTNWLISLGVIPGDPCCGEPADSLDITATETLAAAPVLRSVYNLISAGGASYFVKLPKPHPGQAVYINNDSGTAITVQPYDSTATIDGGSSTAQADGTTVIYVVNAAGDWITYLTI